MKRILLLIMFAVLFLQGKAAWTNDLDKNTQITPSDLNYYERDMRTNKNGNTYLMLVSPAANGLSMRLQVVDKNGDRMLGRGGKIISNEPNRSWTTWNQSLELDADGNAFVAVQDKRTGDENMHYTIYKYSETGEQLWPGTILNDSKGYPIEAGMSMAATEDGGLLCTYLYTDYEANHDYVHVEKLNKDGKSVWKKEVFEAEKVSTPFPFLVKSEGTRAILMWVDGASIKANIIDTENGDTEKDKPVTIYTNGFASSKVMEVITISQGPDGGALVSVVDGNLQGRLVYVKHDLTLGLDQSTEGVLLDQSGRERFASTAPAVAYCQDDNTFACGYKIFSYDNTDNQAVYYQKLNADGTTKWAEAKELVPLQTDSQYSYFIMRNIDNGGTALFFLNYDNSTRYVKGQMLTFDKDGNHPDAPTDFTTSNTVKTELWVSEQQSDKRFFTAWNTTSNMASTLYMQDVKIDASSGICLPKDNNTFVNPKYFSIDGFQTNGLAKGISIVKGINGKAVKVAR